MGRSLTYHNLEPEQTLPNAAPRTAARTEFAKRLQRAMAEKGWNQSELATKAAKYTADNKFGRYSVSNYVRGFTLPRPEHLNAMAKALGIEPRDLLPTRGVPHAGENTPPLDLKMLDDGKAWLRVNQAVSMKAALEIMRILNDDNEKNQ